MVDAECRRREQLQTQVPRAVTCLRMTWCCRSVVRLGREVFNFEKDASVNQIVAAINLVSDATGVVASQDSGTLVLNSTRVRFEGHR